MGYTEASLRHEALDFGIPLSNLGFQQLPLSNLGFSNLGFQQLRFSGALGLAFSRRNLNDGGYARSLPSTSGRTCACLWVFFFFFFFLVLKFCRQAENFGRLECCEHRFGCFGGRNSNEQF